MNLSAMKTCRHLSEFDGIIHGIKDNGCNQSNLKGEYNVG